MTPGHQGTALYGQYVAQGHCSVRPVSHKGTAMYGQYDKGTGLYGQYHTRALLCTASITQGHCSVRPV